MIGKVPSDRSASGLVRDEIRLGGRGRYQSRSYPIRLKAERKYFNSKLLRRNTPQTGASRYPAFAHPSDHLICTF